MIFHRTRLAVLMALLLSSLSACAGFNELPAALSGPDAEAAMGQTMRAACAAPQADEIEAMRDLALEEAKRREGMDWTEQQLAAGTPPEAVDKLIDALVIVDQNGDPNEAEALILAGMRIEEAGLAPLAPSRLTSAGLLASLYAKEGRFNEAIPVERYIVALNGQAFGPFYESTVDHMMRLAILELEAGDVDRANGRYGCARAAAAALWGGSDPAMLARLDAAYRRLAAERAG